MIKVLIAEDDFRVASIHEQFLQKIDHVQVAGKVQSADEIISFLKINPDTDLVLLDIYMPNKLGLDIIPAIRDEFPTIDIIMISASNEKSHLEYCIKYGVLNYFIKPVSFEKLEQTIHNYLRKRSLLDHNEEINQSFIDSLFSLESTNVEKVTFPKGIDPLSLEKARQILKQSSESFTTEEMTEKMGVSRTTARRYLEYLVSIDEIKAELVYGIVGRPERKYFKK